MDWIVLGGIIGLIVVAVVAVYVITEMRLNKSYTIEPEAITIPWRPDLLH